jgi:endonuclease YncB( thermonuclease family)
MWSLPLSRVRLHTTPEFTLKGHVYKCQIVSVVNGDTIRVAFKPFLASGFFTFQVQLVNLNAPVPHPDETIKGLVVKSYLINFLDKHQICYLVCDDFDSLGRIMGHLYLDKKLTRSVNESISQFIQHQQYDCE